MKLNEIISTTIEVKISRLDAPLCFNQLSLDDENWLSQRYPTQSEIQSIFTGQNYRAILEIAVRIMSIDTKRILARVNLYEVDDETGKETELKDISLSEKLYRLCSYGELSLIIEAIFEARKKSTDIIEKLSKKHQKKIPETKGHYPKKKKATT